MSERYAYPCALPLLDPDDSRNGCPSWPGEHSCELRLPGNGLHTNGQVKQEGTGWDVGYGLFRSPIAVGSYADRFDVAILFLCSKEAKWVSLL